MKTRSGFVSNSSSSSFVVRRVDLHTDAKTTTPKQDLALEGFGFRKTIAHSPHQVPTFYDKKAWKEEASWMRRKYYKTGFNYGYEITCNQDEVITFLIENRISFVASCHYGHESIVYKGEENVIYIGQNYGAIMETYGVKENSLDKTVPVVKMSGGEWLKKNQY